MQGHLRKANRRRPPRTDARARLAFAPAALGAGRAAGPKVAHVVTASMTTRLMRRQLRFLREAGFDVTLISSPGRELEMMAEQEGVARIPVPMEREISPLADVRSLWLLFRTIRRLRPDLVNTGTAKAGLLAGVAARLAGVPCRVYTVHGLRLETLTGIKRRIVTWAERVSCGSADRVLCVSASVQARAAELRLASPTKTCLLGAGSFNGVDAARFAPTPQRRAHAAALRRELGIAPRAPVIGFVGRLTRDKGIAELVQAYQEVRRRVPEARLLLLGEFESDDPVPAPARALIESDPGVIHPGYVSDPAVHFQVMDVLALPTYREGFPTVALEASAAGKPIVATRATGAVDAVVDGVTGLLTPVGDAAALADALERIISDPALAERMGAAGRERVVRDFATERVCAELACLYRELLQARGETAAGPCQHGKRLLDIAGALVGLALTGPLMAVAAGLVWVTMGSPVIFRQRRAGRRGEPFWLLKLRTMDDWRDEFGRLLPDEERMKRLGRSLRRLSIDELPQLWNVLKGEMSLVGPRPLLIEYLPAYTEREQLRHAVRPGITGWAQVNGRHTALFSRRLALDSWYVEHWSHWLDLRILLATVVKISLPSESRDRQDASVDDRGFWKLLQPVGELPGQAGATITERSL